MTFHQVKSISKTSLRTLEAGSDNEKSKQLLLHWLSSVQNAPPTERRRFLTCDIHTNWQKFIADWVDQNHQIKTSLKGPPYEMRNLHSAFHASCNDEHIINSVIRWQRLDRISPRIEPLLKKDWYAIFIPGQWIKRIPLHIMVCHYKTSMFKLSCFSCAFTGVILLHVLVSRSTEMRRNILYGPKAAA